MSFTIKHILFSMEFKVNKKFTSYDVLVYLLLILPAAQLMFTWLNVYIVAAISFASLFSFSLLSYSSSKFLIIEKYLIIASAFLSVFVTLFAYQRAPLILIEPTSLLAAIRHLFVFVSIFITISFFSSPKRASNFALSLDTCLFHISLPLSIYMVLQQYRYFMTTVSQNLYQGGTSWLALIPLVYSLYNQKLPLISRLLIISLSFFSIFLASKRSALLSALLIVCIFLVSNIIGSVIKTLVSLRIKYSLVTFLLLGPITFLCAAYANLDIITIFKDLDFSKLSLTLSYILDIGSSSNAEAITTLTGGRNLEFDSLLTYLNVSIADYVLSVVSLGFGVGWFNSTFGDGTSSIHNSLLLLLMIGGLPMLVFEFRLVGSLLSKLYTHIRQPLMAVRCVNYQSLSPISFALLVDSFFSANLVVSPLCMILVLMSLSKKDAGFSRLHPY